MLWLVNLYTYLLSFELILILTIMYEYSKGLIISALFNKTTRRCKNLIHTRKWLNFIVRLIF